MSNQSVLILKGNIIHAISDSEWRLVSNGYIVCEDGKITDVFEYLPERYNGAKVEDYGDNIIIPGLVDLHLHAPQFASRGMGMDLELLPWLKKYAFTEEMKYADGEYAEKAYRAFCDALKHSPTTRASVYATLHVPATEMLMQMLEETGLVTYIGKVNMDRNSPERLVESTPDSIANTAAWIENALSRYTNTRPILTPRFVPSCSAELMAALGDMSQRYQVPVQSHLSENRSEVEWVKALHPEHETYGDVYNQFGLFGQVPTIMAHCIHLTEREFDLMKSNGVYVAHCPQSNTNLSSGIAPVREMLNRGIHVGLGTDIAGGFSISVFRSIVEAIQASKLYAVLIDPDKERLKLSEAFYLATKGGGSFWGKVGSFEPGYELDAVVIDDSDINGMTELTLEQRLERIIHLSSDGQIKAKYVNGKAL